MGAGLGATAMSNGMARESSAYGCVGAYIRVSVANIIPSPEFRARRRGFAKLNGQWM
jgi:hypothetical protein